MAKKKTQTAKEKKLAEIKEKKAVTSRDLGVLGRVEVASSKKAEASKDVEDEDEGDDEELSAEEKATR